MGVVHSMDEGQVHRVSNALKNSAEAIQGIDRKFDIVDTHMDTVKEFNHKINHKIEESLNVLQNLDETFSDRAENVLETIFHLTDSIADNLERVLNQLRHLDIKREASQLPKVIIPLALPFIVLLLELAIAIAFLGILLASMPDVKRKYSSFLLINAILVLFGLMMSLGWLGCYRFWLSRRTRPRQVDDWPRYSPYASPRADEEEDDDADADSQMSQRSQRSLGESAQLERRRLEHSIHDVPTDLLELELQWREHSMNSVGSKRSDNARRISFSTLMRRNLMAGGREEGSDSDSGKSQSSLERDRRKREWVRLRASINLPHKALACARLPEQHDSSLEPPLSFLPSGKHAADIQRVREEYRASRQLTTPPPCVTTESSGVVMPYIRARRFTHCGVPSSSSTPLSTRISRKARIGAMRSPFLRNAMQSRARSHREECVDDRRSRDSTSEPEEVRRIPVQEPRRTTTSESRSRHSPESRSKHSSGGKKPRLVLDSGFSFQVLWGGDRNPSGNQSTREVGETSSPAVEDANSQRR